MPYDLSNITTDTLHSAISVTIPGEWDKTEESEQFWFNKHGKLFSFRSVLTLAYMSSSGRFIALKHPVLNYNRGWMDDIAARGLRICYRDERIDSGKPAYWVAGTTYGPANAPVPMLDDFLKHNYWGTDHTTSSAEGQKILTLLTRFRLNDRLALRKFNRTTGIVETQAIGTIIDISLLKTGRVKVIWDKNAPLYSGKKPLGKGAGNWWSTLLELTRTEDIWQIFQEGNEERRLARIAWNTNGWLFPSGAPGKSKSIQLQEGQYHYGGEEWLFDTEKLVDHYHYGFLQPVHKSQAAFLNKYFETHLYTIDAISGCRYYIGYIDELEPITPATAESVKYRYQVNNWLKQMEKDVLHAGGILDNLKNKSGIDLFNVRFRPKNLHLQAQPMEIPAGHPFNTYTRYIFTRIELPILAKELMVTGQDMPFHPSPLIQNTDLDQTLPAATLRAPRFGQNLQLHEKISKHLTRYLQQLFPGCVSREATAGYDAKRVDIILRNHDGEIIYYEIKTYNNVMSCIREAVGQLMEYALYPDQNRAKLWNIVSPHPLTSEGKTYLDRLNKDFKLPFHYLQYDMATDQLTSWT